MPPWLLAIMYFSGPFCLFKGLFHLPCPTCGMTRAFWALAQGQFLEAARYHALAIPLAMGAASFLLAYPAFPAPCCRVIRFVASRAGLWSLAALVLLAWGLKLLGPARYW
ncbi:MAG: DUF2752 domain-containing protein [Vampirovibrionales bacterium]|nr:DUF2752 domain-containing protein [Vampirovibrionales bacterium]